LNLQTQSSEVAETTFTILVFGDGIKQTELEQACVSLGESSVQFQFEDTIVGALNAIITGQSDLNLVTHSHKNAVSILEEISESGTHAPTYIVASPDAEESLLGDDQYLGFPVLVMGEAIQHQLPIIIATSIEKQFTARKFRSEKDELIRQLLDLRDEQERIRAQSIKVIEMAENLEYSKRSLERLNSEKDHLFSIIAHDLRSPFNSILGYSQLLATSADKLQPDQIKDYANSTNIAATNVFKLMQTLLEWARLQIGRVDYEPKWCRVKDVAAATIDVYANIAQRKGITLVSEDSELLAYCDQGMAETIVRNLINNAVKFTHRGGLVEIRFRELENEVEISVRDNGVGMTEAQIENCFRIGNNITSTDGTKGETGTGLGLSICRDMVEKNGGSISVESKVGLGSTFTFTLPNEAQDS
jgi:signal transduction histidine kinase